MKDVNDIEALERLIGQLQGLHNEVTQLSKKSPNDAVNAFKLKLINRVISDGNSILGDRYMPFDDFEQFDADDLPSNSDVTVVLSQYMEQAERFRSDNVVFHQDSFRHVYRLDGKASGIEAAPPTIIRIKK